MACVILIPLPPKEKIIFKKCVNNWKKTVKTTKTTSMYIAGWKRKKKYFTLLSNRFKIFIHLIHVNIRWKLKTKDVSAY